MSKILIGNVSRIQCDFLVELIRELGYQPLISGAGSECIEIMNQDNPDLILLDSNVSIQEGWNVLKVIRLTNRQIPIIILDSEITSYSKKEYLSLGASDVLDMFMPQVEFEERIKKQLQTINLNGSTHKKMEMTLEY